MWLLNVTVELPTQEKITSIQQQWLLDAVKHIKSQKQRPDRERICHFIQQSHDLTSETISLLLDSAVKDHILTTTITRGNTDKLTYVIQNPSLPTSLQPASNTKSVEVDSTGLVASDADNKLLLHTKSDISPLMVKAVKGLLYFRSSLQSRVSV